MATARIPSAARRRQIARPFPAKLERKAHAVYVALFDLILDRTLEGSALPRAREVVTAEFRADAEPAQAIRGLFKLFTFGLPDEQMSAVETLFAQIMRFADANVRRSLPTVSATTFFSREAVRGMQLAQVERIKQATLTQVRQIDDIVKANVGTPPRELAELLRQQTQTSKNKAKLWARDQTLKLNAEITKQRHLSLGVEEYVWTTSQDERVRERHQELANRTFRYDDPPISDSGEPINPGEDYQCRCIAFPVTPSAEILNVTPDVDRIRNRQARAAEILSRRRRRR